MSEKILVTDSLFIFPEHEEILRKAGYEVERLDKSNATEAELVEAIKGKTGYIMGGVEKVTEKVIESADKLKVIAFTGSDWKAFIPGHEIATKKGIAIANTPGANSYAVGEYVLTLTLAMMRNIFELGRTGTQKFQTTHSLSELTVGIIGMGNVGTKVVNDLKALGAHKVVYFNKTRKTEVENLGIDYEELPHLLNKSDIVVLLVPKSAGPNFLGESELKSMKDGALLVNVASPSLIDKEALLNELKSGRLRAVFDTPIDERFGSLPLSVWFNSNESTAYNTFWANKTASDMAVKSMINLLSGPEDSYKVN